MSDPGQLSASWQLAPAEMDLSVDRIEVWRRSTEVSAETLAGFEAVLSDEEWRRAERLRDPVKRVESMVARGFLRCVLAKVLRSGPKELAFATGPHGKPYLIGAVEARRVCFNLSHTSGWVLVAVAEGRDVGVDVERVRPEFAWRPVAQQFFEVDEARVLLALPEETGRAKFFESWVRKEALLKAAGIGMAQGLDEASVSGTVVSLNVGAGWAAAVAVLRGDAAIRLWEWGDSVPGRATGF